MAYTKTVWKARQGTNLNKFTKSQETSGSVVLTNTPDSISQEGTPFSAENMNHIEQGIADAHEALVGTYQLVDRGYLPTGAGDLDYWQSLSAGIYYACPDFLTSDQPSSYAIITVIKSKMATREGFVVWKPISRAGSVEYHRSFYANYLEPWRTIGA